MLWGMFYPFAIKDETLHISLQLIYSIKLNVCICRPGTSVITFYNQSGVVIFIGSIYSTPRIGVALN